uniref:C-type lectin domain family 12 member B-like n=1 Tax=Pristiophorus japonicus TaxID=55135 RepID=UPI00398E92DA
MNLKQHSKTSNTLTTGATESCYAQLNFKPQAPQATQAPVVTAATDGRAPDTAGGKLAFKPQCGTILYLVVFLCVSAIITGLTVHVLQVNEMLREMQRDRDGGLARIQGLMGQAKEAQALVMRLRGQAQELVAQVGTQGQNLTEYVSESETLKEWINLLSNDRAHINQSLAEAQKNIAELDAKVQECTASLVQATERKDSLCQEIKRCMGSTCPTGWQSHKGHCYSFSTQQVSWDKAKKQCDSKNSHLTVINTKEEQDFLYSRARIDYRYSQTYWIGLSKKSWTGNWNWLDGTEPRFTNWPSYRVPQSADKNCAITRTYYNEWSDVSCSGSRYFICEKCAPACVVEVPAVDTLCS